MSRRAMSRRIVKAIAVAVTLTTAAFATACGSGSGGDDGSVELTFVSYGGTGQDAMIKAWQEPYTAANPNITFINTSPPDPAQVKAQVEAGAVTWDLVSTAPWLASQNCGTIYAKLNVEIDESQFPPNLHGECFIADFRYSLIFGYNAKKWPDPATAPKTIQDFFDTEKFPGKRGVVPALQDGILEWALIADGVDPEDVYPVDVPRALAKWDSIREHTTWAANVGALLQLVTSEQVDMQLMVQARNQAALDAGTPLVPVWDVTMTSINGMAIPLGAPHQAEAEKFMSFMLQPEQQATMAELSGVAPSNLLSQPSLTETGEKINAFGPANTGRSVAVDPIWWGQNWNQISEEFNRWLNV